MGADALLAIMRAVSEQNIFCRNLLATTNDVLAAENAAIQFFAGCLWTK